MQNPNDDAVQVQVKTGAAAQNFDVPAHGAVSVRGPDGLYQIYFIYAKLNRTEFLGGPIP